MRVLYDISIRFYRLMIGILSPWNQKAKLWIKGRKNWKKELKGRFSSEDELIWVHCASLGEFEQGRPVIEKIRKEREECKILLTFFSPSGYEKRKNYKEVDFVTYLPLDTPRNAKIFLDLIPVTKAVFIKYEFWYHFMNQLSIRGIQTYLVSGIFRKEQLFFRWYGKWYLKILDKYTHIFVQNEESLALLRNNTVEHASLAGDTRFDRVMEISAGAMENDAVNEFSKDSKVIIVGSSWEDDENMILGVFSQLGDEYKLIIAPHEPTERNLLRIRNLFPGSILFSGLEYENPSLSQVMIIDTVGHLSSLYRYAYLAFVGGGFGKGIHNILEATAAGLPVFFGPNYRNFKEAVDLIRMGAAFPVRNKMDVLKLIQDIERGDMDISDLSSIAYSYTKENTGASEKVVKGMF